MSIILEADISSIKDKLDVVKKPDKDGYYRQIGGALNVFNSEGDYYPLTKAVINLFNASASLTRRIKNGALKAEVNHPVRESGMSDEDFARRWLSIDENNVCALFRKIEISDTPVSAPGQKGKIYPIWIEYKPHGVKKDILIESLNTKEANTAFSIRCLSKPANQGGVKFKHIFYVIDFDYVPEPGINVASAYNTALMSGESHSFEITDDVVHLLVDQVSSNMDQFSGEEKERYQEAINAIQECYGPECALKGW